MASIVISDDTQVMLLAELVFASYASKEVGDAAESTAAILVLGVESPTEVDELVDKAIAAGAKPAGTPITGGDGDRYQRGFADLDGHHWEALCLV